MSIIPRPVPILKQSPTHGYVYIIKSDSGHYKIGKSIRPDKRVGEFSLQLPFKNEIVHIFECADYTASERILHDVCRRFHVNGEWFSLPPKVIDFLAALLVRGMEEEHQEHFVENRGALQEWFVKLGEAGA